jgi:hypothetical protein
MHDFKHWSHAFFIWGNMAGRMMTMSGDNKHERRERDGGYCK